MGGNWSIYDNFHFSLLIFGALVNKNQLENGSSFKNIKNFHIFILSCIGRTLIYNESFYFVKSVDIGQDMLISSYCYWGKKNSGKINLFPVILRTTTQKYLILYNIETLYHISFYFSLVYIGQDTLNPIYQYIWTSHGLNMGRQIQSDRGIHRNTQVLVLK